MTGKVHSLQSRLLVLVLAVVVIVWLATAVLTWIDVRHELDELLDGHLAQAAAILVVQQAQDMDSEGPGLDAPSLHRYAPKVAFQIFHEGQLTLRSANAPLLPMSGAHQNFREGFETVQIDGTAWRVFTAYGGERDVQVYVGEETASRGSILWAVLRGTLLPMAVALPILALALWWAVYRSVEPMRRFGRALAQRQPNALQPLELHGAPTEMLPLVDALNGLLARIATLLESERRFTADASHELRTPIAAIRAQAQVALGEPNDALRRLALNNTLAGCDRATHLVEQLLTLSRLEASEVPDMEELDLTALARQVVAELANKAIGKGQKLEFVGSQHCTLQANATLLEVLIRNVVDNAIRYSPAAACVSVSVVSRNGLLELRVEDSGPGLAEADLLRLGERFFRVPGNMENGSGLGWSIVRRIAAVNHLTIQFDRSKSLGGLSVSILN
jgi:two-component system sensor histidine kinase QseC